MSNTYMARRRIPPSPGWKTLLRNHADGIASLVLFLVPTISFRLLYGLLILRHSRRELLWPGVTAHPTAEWVARQPTEAYGWQQSPRFIVATGIASMARPFAAGFEPWAFEIGRSHHDRQGKMDARRGSSDRSDGIALTLWSCLASGTFAIY
jgi:hypothetical protein